MKPLRGKRVGSAQSARGIQLSGPGDAARCGRIPSRDLPPLPAGPPPGAFPPRRCVATGSGSARKGLGRRWLAAPAASFTAPPARNSPLTGAADSVLAAPSLPLNPGRDGAPSLPARLSTGADCPQCAPTASRRQGGDRPTPKAQRVCGDVGYPPDPS